LHEFVQYDILLEAKSTYVDPKDGALKAESLLEMKHMDDNNQKGEKT